MAMLVLDAHIVWAHPHDSPDVFVPPGTIYSHHSEHSSSRECSVNAQHSSSREQDGTIAQLEDDLRGLVNGCPTGG